MVEIKQRLVPTYEVGGKLYAKGKHRNAYVGMAGKNSATEIAVHQTGNTGKGANADMHARLQENGNTRIAGWPFQVDDIEAIQSFLEDKRVYHTGTNHGHKNAIGVEICINSDGDYKKAVKNGAELVRCLMKKHNIPLSKVKQHHDYSGKNCPAQIRANKDGISWNDFKNMIEAKEVEKSSNIVKPSSNDTSIAGAKLVKNEDAYFLATENIKVRNAPSVSAKHTGTFPKGESLHYRRVFQGNGYRWLEYTGNSGATLYIPYRRLSGDTSNWGTFHSTRPQSKSIKKGDKVRLEASAKKYATGEAIPSKYKKKAYTVQSVKSDRVLLKEIYSWAHKDDVTKI